MLLHIDGSKHRWLNDDRWYDLIVILDDATSEIYYAQLVEEESTRTAMAALREVIQTKGLFCALYSDRGSHFFVTVKEGERVDKQRLTQVGRASRSWITRLNTRPARSPVNASSPLLREASHDSGPSWVANPSTYDSFIHYTLPVLTGAQGDVTNEIGKENHSNRDLAAEPCHGNCHVQLANRPCVWPILQQRYFGG
jgi:hypothetical protein